MGKIARGMVFEFNKNLLKIVILIQNRFFEKQDKIGGLNPTAIRPWPAADFVGALQKGNGKGNSREITTMAFFLTLRYWPDNF